MKKLILSLLHFGLISSALAVSTYAIFTSRASNQGNTFSTGNANLQIRNAPTQSWSSSYSGAEWQNLYPGWSDSYLVYFKNTSSSPVALKIRPKIEVDDVNFVELLDKIFMEISWQDGSHSSGIISFADWTNDIDNEYLDPYLNQNQEAGPFLVNFSIPTTVDNEIINSNVLFNLIFDAEQVL